MTERDLQKDLELCESVPRKPWRAMSKQTTGLGRANLKTCNYATVIDGESHEIIQPCWGDAENGGHPYFWYIPSRIARFIAAAREALPYWIRRTQMAEADNAAIAGAATKAFHMLCQEKLTSDTIREVIDLLRPAAVEPHPGDSVRTRLAKLEEVDKG